MAGRLTVQFSGPAPMPVQFVCQKCRKRLSVSHRKQGAVVDCPNCGQPNVVPEERAAPTSAALPSAALPSAALPSAAMAALAGEAPNEPAIPEVIVFDDVPDLIAEQARAAPAFPPGAANPPPASEAPTNKAPALSSVGVPPPPPAASNVWSSPVVSQTAVKASSSASQVSARLKPRPEEAWLLLSRPAVYALAGLLSGVAVFAFLAGFLIGRGGPATERESVQGDPAAQADPVALEGSVIYSAAPGNYQADADAVVAAVPVDQSPAQKLPSVGLRPDDADDPRGTSLGRALHELGGAAARANAEGDFQLVVPRPGDFHLLLVSRHAKRPAGKQIARDELAEMAKYFADPAGLIGPQKYAWTRRRLSGAPAPMSHDFGADGK